MLQMFRVRVCYKHLHLQKKLYLSEIHFAYLRTGVQYNSAVRITTLLNVSNVFRFK